MCPYQIGKMQNLIIIRLVMGNPQQFFKFRDAMCQGFKINAIHVSYSIPATWHHAPSSGMINVSPPLAMSIPIHQQNHLISVLFTHCPPAQLWHKSHTNPSPTPLNPPTHRTDFAGWGALARWEGPSQKLVQFFPPILYPSLGPYFVFSTEAIPSWEPYRSPVGANFACLRAAPVLSCRG